MKKPNSTCSTAKARRDAAEERQEKWAAISLEQQVEALDLRLGSGMGATKQRERIAKAVELRDAPKPPKKREPKRSKKERKGG